MEIMYWLPSVIVIVVLMVVLVREYVMYNTLVTLKDFLDENVPSTGKYIAIRQDVSDGDFSIMLTPYDGDGVKMYVRYSFSSGTVWLQKHKNGATPILTIKLVNIKLVNNGNKRFNSKILNLLEEAVSKIIMLQRVYPNMK